MSVFAELLVFGLEQRRYALPVEVVERALPMPAILPLPDAPVIVLGVVDLEGAKLAVLDVRRRFGLPPRRPRLRDILLIAQTSRRRVALPVDEVHGLEQCPAESITPAEDLAPGLQQWRGVVTFPGHDLVLIQDLERFLSLDEEAALERASAR